MVNHLRNGYEMGVDFWDLADDYGSHESASKALKHIDREKIVINTKTVARDYQTCMAAVERFLRELKSSRAAMDTDLSVDDDEITSLKGDIQRLQQYLREDVGDIEG